MLSKIVTFYVVNTPSFFAFKKQNKRQYFFHFKSLYLQPEKRSVRYIRKSFF